MPCPTPMREDAAVDVRQKNLSDARQELIEHPIYQEIRTADDVRTFMQHHVFAVWDFFSLLKRLQREVTCVQTPWRPRRLAEHGRFVMEIVLSEETDHDLGGGYTSHFELYRRAMDECGADARAIDAYGARIEEGIEPIAALEHDAIPESVRSFVTHTLDVALNGSPVAVAASFCHGREDLLPDVLGALRASIGGLLGETPVFAHYIDRHIELDHDEHGPLARRLLASLTDGDPEAERAAERVGIEAVLARTRLWDGIVEEIRARRVVSAR
jgi:DUF3050 family protein